MMNGPMGGNMATPAAPTQPPQVNFTTTAESRGGFNNFLKSIPSTINTMPPINPMGAAPTAPMGGNPMANIDIFNQPMGMMGMNQPPMNPMMQPPMQQPMMQQPNMNMGGGIMGKPVQNFYNGGYADDDFGGFSDYGSVDAPSDNSNDSNDGYDYSDDDNYQDSGYDITDDQRSDNQAEAENFMSGGNNQDDRPLTNIVNVGPRSNLRYDPQFTANNLQSRGLDPSGFMGIDNYAQTTQGKAEEAMNAVNQLSDRSMPTMGDLGASQNIAGAIGPANIASGNIASAYSPFSDLDDRNGLGFSALDDPLGLGINTGYGPVADAARNREALTGAFGTPNYTQQAGLPTANDVTNMNTGSRFDRNNPNEMRALENAVRDSFAQQIDTTLVDTDRNFNKDGTISKAGITEENDMINSYMSDAIKGDKNVLDGLDFNASPSIQTANAAPTGVAPDPMATDRSPGRMSAVFGPEIASLAGGLTPNEIMREVNITDPSQSGQFPNYQDPALSRDQQIAQDVSNITAYNNYTDPNVNSGNIPSDMSFSDLMNATTPGTTEYNNTRGFTDKDLAPNTTDIFSPNDINTGTKASSVSNALNQPEAAIKDAVPSRSISDILSAMNQKTDLQSQVNQNFRNAGVNVTDRGRIGDINRNDLSDIIDGNIGIDPSIQAALNAQSELDQAPSSSLGFASNKGIPGYDFSMTDVNPNIAVEAGGKGIGANVDTSPPPADYEENVGKPYSGLDVGKVEDFYNSPTAFDRLGVPPGMFSTALNFAEKKARDFVASDLISGNFDPIYDRDGKITGSRNPRTGQVQSGMDFNAPDTGSNDNDDPIILPKRLVEEEAEEDKPPNVIGGGVPAPVTEPNPFIVDSPFTSNVGDYSPVGFSAGDLNALIAKLTGGVNPKSMRRGGVASYANGGLISAVDNFLASAR